MKELVAGLEIAKIADFMAVVRVAVCGRANAPDLYSVMQVLGRERTVERLNGAIA